LILEESEKLYNQFITKLTNGVIAAVVVADIGESSLPLPPTITSRN
jgi:hypothetical protein